MEDFGSGNLRCLPSRPVRFVTAPDGAVGTGKDGHEVEERCHLKGLNGSDTGMLAMRLRLSDAATSAVLAEHYRMQAEVCHQMALISLGPIKEGWLELAPEWTKLAQETEAKQHSAEPPKRAG